MAYSLDDLEELIEVLRRQNVSEFQNGEVTIRFWSNENDNESVEEEIPSRQADRIAAAEERERGRESSPYKHHSLGKLATFEGL